MGGVRLGGVTAVVACALALAGSAAAVDVGANDSMGKYEPDAGAAFYREMAAVGLRQTVVTVRWLPSDPLGLTERPVLDLTVAAARAAGLRVVLATYPYPPREIEAGLAQPAAFGAWLGELARHYPDVKQYVVGNEPNQPAFWRPQFQRGRQVSARAFGPFLAAGYDALKAVDPAIDVVGVGLSPRGNDRPLAKSNISTSPLRFLAALGAWYRASGRPTPLMDGFSFHPYPNRATDPLDRGYAWPNAGFVDLGRIKQALWDAFAGTSQPTTLEGLRLYLDEVGWQVDTSGLDGYDGPENVEVTDEVTQASVYADLLRRSACDPDIAQVNVFGFRDDGLRTGFQAGLYRADRSPRPSAEAVRVAIEDDACAPGYASSWRPAAGVRGAKLSALRAGASSIGVELAAAEGASARVCQLSGTHTLSSARRALASRAVRTGVCVSATVVSSRRIVLGLPRTPGSRTLAVQFAAEANAGRTTTIVRPLR